MEVVSHLQRASLLHMTLGQRFLNYGPRTPWGGVHEFQRGPWTWMEKKIRDLFALMPNWNLASHATLTVSNKIINGLYYSKNV